MAVAAPAIPGPAATPAQLHRWFVTTAEALSPALARDLAQLGPVWFPERADHGPAAFLARTVVGQQISASAARSIWGRIEARAQSEGVALAAYLAAADATALRACGLSGNKVKAVLNIHAAAAAGMLAELRGIPHETRSGRLREIWGIGQWSCDMLALFYCREPDIWPAGDLAVQRGFRAYIGRRKPEPAALRFAPWRSLLALALWRLAGAQWK
jgi:DNA-3-methyladenine glycosylase II